MDYSFAVPLLSEHSISALTSRTLALLSQDDKERLRVVIDNAGRRSAQAQGLPGPITSMIKLVHSDHVLHVCSEKVSSKKTVVVGIIKTGKKKLFIYNDSPVLHEIEPLCVLDFYVHESFQRKGYGKKLFEHVLQHERVRPEKLAYDRPSPKFLAFLSKHYRLSNHIPQQNNFVVFRKYFNSRVDDRPVAVCKVSNKAGDPWTPISQRPLTAKRKKYRRNNNNSTGHSPKVQAQNQSKFHRSENFVHFKNDKAKNHVRQHQHQHQHQYHSSVHSDYHSAKDVNYLTRKDEYGWKETQHSPSVSNSVGLGPHAWEGEKRKVSPSRTSPWYDNNSFENYNSNSAEKRAPKVSFNLRNKMQPYMGNDTSSKQESSSFISPPDKEGMVKYGRRSGHSPRIGGLKKSSWDTFQNINMNHPLHRKFQSPPGMSKQNNVNYSRIRNVKHMGGQGAASCLVW